MSAFLFFNHFRVVAGCVGLAIVTVLCLLHWKLVNSCRRLPQSPPGHWLYGNRNIMTKPYRAVVLGTEHGEQLRNGAANLQ